MKSKLKNIGKVPGSIIYTGNKSTVKSEILLTEYNEFDCKEIHVTDFAQCAALDPTQVTWIDFLGIDQTEDIQDIGQMFSIHPLILEDIANIQQRPKIDDMEKYLFISLKTFAYSTEKQKLEEEQISLVLGKDYLISFQENLGNDDFDVIKERIVKAKGKIRKMGPDYLMYSILDAIIDNYFVVLENIEDDIELLQDELINNPTKVTLPKIQQLKQNLIALRKSIWPVREMIAGMQRFESELIHEELYTYFRDLYDHTIQIVDTIETFRDIISGSLDIYLSSINNKMNEIMKVLTIIGTIFIPLTFLVGVYGMNFKYMPELSQKRTYPVLWIIMFLIAAGMMYFFKKKKRF